MYLFGIQFSLLFHVRTDTQSLPLNTDQTIAYLHRIFIITLSHYVFICVFAC